MQTGKGIHWISCCAFSTCSPVSLQAHRGQQVPIYLLFGHSLGDGKVTGRTSFGSCTQPVSGRHNGTTVESARGLDSKQPSPSPPRKQRAARTAAFVAGETAFRPLSEWDPYAMTRRLDTRQRMLRTGETRGARVWALRFGRTFESKWQVGDLSGPLPNENGRTTPNPCQPPIVPMFVLARNFSGLNEFSRI